MTFAQRRRTRREVLGRMSDGATLDISEFDMYGPRLLLMEPNELEEITQIHGDAWQASPSSVPLAAYGLPSSDAAARLAAARARQAAIVAQFGDPLVISPPPPPSSDGGASDGGDGSDAGSSAGMSSGAQQALNDFRNYGIDPFDDAGHDSVVGDVDPWAYLLPPVTVAEIASHFSAPPQPGAFQAAPLDLPPRVGAERGPSPDARVRLASALARQRALQAQRAAYISQHAQSFTAPPTAPNAQHDPFADDGSDATVMLGWAARRRARRR